MAQQYLNQPLAAGKLVALTAYSVESIDCNLPASSRASDAEMIAEEGKRFGGQHQFMQHEVVL